MKKYIERIKRNFVRETLCVNPTVVAVCAAVCACLGLIFAIGGVDYDVYCEIAQPKFYFPSFIMVVLLLLFYALLGAAAGIIISTPYYRKNSHKTISLALAACTLFLCFTWLPLVYTAASFFIAALVCIVVLLFSALIFKFYIKINAVAAWSMLIFAIFDFYLICYSLSLFILN
ncbi:MAG: tryptophan-rich sensory protein [Clostridia bacterium]|nr:tryptophan-rich sensory protein [Clostridia bacterium]